MTEPIPIRPDATSFKSRELEERHLQETEAQIAQGEERIAALRTLIDEAQARGDDVTQAQATLAITMDVQRTFARRRAQLLQTLVDIDSGEYAMPEEARRITSRWIR